MLSVLAKAGLVVVPIVVSDGSQADLGCQVPIHLLGMKVDACVVQQKTDVGRSRLWGAELQGVKTWLIPDL